MQASSWILFFILSTGAISSAEAFSCNFSAGFCGMNQFGDFNWTRHKGPTPTRPKYKTGPTKDHTTGDGYYIYIEASDNNDSDVAIVRTPPETSSNTTICLSFSFSAIGAKIGNLSVMFSTQETIPIQCEVWHHQGQDKKPEWKEQVVDIAVDSNQFYISFEGTGGPGGTGDMALDDISTTEGSCNGTTIAPVNCLRTTTPAPTTSTSSPTTTTLSPTTTTLSPTTTTLSPTTTTLSPTTTTPAPTKVTLSPTTTTLSSTTTSPAPTKVTSTTTITPTPTTTTPGSTATTLAPISTTAVPTITTNAPSATVSKTTNQSFRTSSVSSISPAVNKSGAESESMDLLPVIAGAAAGFVLLVGAMLVLIICCRKNKLRHSERRVSNERRVSHQSSDAEKTPQADVPKIPEVWTNFLKNKVIPDKHARFYGRPTVFPKTNINVMYDETINQVPPMMW